jgi:hypothetical protein
MARRHGALGASVCVLGRGAVMIIEIAPFDLVDGNRYIPAEVIGHVYCDAVHDGLTKQLTPELRPGTANNDPAPIIDVSVVLCDPVKYPSVDHGRARITVRAGRSPANGFTAASIGLARALFMVKDAAVEIIDLVDPPFEEWFPRPQEAAL